MGHLIYLTLFTLLINLIQNNEMGGVCSSDGEGRGVTRVLVGKPEGKTQQERPRYRWGHSIKMGLEEVGCGVRFGFAGSG
jgi:hypothetical protein